MIPLCGRILLLSLRHFLQSSQALYLFSSSILAQFNMFGNRFPIFDKNPHILQPLICFSISTLFFVFRYNSHFFALFSKKSGNRFPVCYFERADLPFSSYLLLFQHLHCPPAYNLVGNIMGRGFFLTARYIFHKLLCCHLSFLKVRNPHSGKLRSEVCRKF